ncbi:hypothetical protein G6F56_011466 [Rhizopus delemar]|nr:hypothetical protein G6F56_011466 [Rhizopus delemar]
MSNSFASLLRGSRLATFDRSIQQVYKTPSRSKRIGDWGLKRNLPTVIRTPHLTVGSLDTAEHQTPWRSGSSQVLFTKRWQENFFNSKRPSPRSDTESYNIVKMTPAEFNRFLQHCAKKAPEFERLLQQKAKVPEQVFDYLQVKFADGPGDHVVGPTYSDYTVTEPYAVEGRILNAAKYNGHVVGIGGVTAFLPKRYSLRLRQLGDRRVRTFYVEEAEIDEEGKPKVTLSLSPAGGNSKSHLSFNFHYEEDPNNTPTVHEMFLTRKSPIDKMKSDNIQANPDHESLMLRIKGLIDESYNKK